MFVYIRYLDDDVRAVVKKSDIRHFYPKSVTDFVKTKVYWAYWSAATKKSENQDSEGFYKAQILLMAETEEEVQNLIRTTRIPVAKIRQIEEDSNSSDDETQMQEQIASSSQVVKKARRAESTLSNFVSILGERKKELKKNTLIPPVKSDIPKVILSSDESSDDDVVPKKDLTQLQNKYEHLKRNFVILKREVAEIEAVKTELKLVQGQFSKVTEENDKLRSLNMELQKTLLTKLSQDAPSTPVVNADMISAQKQSTGDCEMLPMFSSSDGRIHLGKNVFIPENKWNVIADNKRNSLFVKDLAVAVWGTSHLKKRSVDGIVCNRLKSKGAIAKPPLTPQKVKAIQKSLEEWLIRKDVAEDEVRTRSKKVKSYISDKIMYLNRKARETTTGQVASTAEIRPDATEGAQNSDSTLNLDLEF